MAIFPDPVPKSAVGENIRKQLGELQQHNRDEDAAIKNEKGARWYRPDGFDASLFDLQAFHEPFARDEHEEQFVNAVKNPESAGTTSDLAMASLQGDMLHAMERAFRARHHSSVRTRIQPGGRKMGHAHDQGVIKEGLLGYFVNLDRMNQGEDIS